MVFFNLLNFFAIFFYFLLRFGLERNGTIIFIFSFSQPFPTYVGLKWCRNGFFFIFFIFLLFFLKFSIARRMGTKRNDNFYFLYFSAFSNLFWLEIKPQWYVLIYWIFLLFFFNFLLRFGLERNGTIIFIFSFSQPFTTYVGLKWCRNGFFFHFFHFFAIFFEIFYSASGGNETERQFLFSLFPDIFQPILA